MLARRSLWIAINTIIGAMFGYIALFSMARFMGAEVVGSREYALSLVFLAGLITRLGFPTTHARRLGRGDDVATSVGAYLGLKVAMTAVFILLAAGGGWLWFGILEKTLTDLTVTALWMGLLIIVVRSIRDVAVGTFRGLHFILEREVVLFTNTLVTVALTTLSAMAFAWSHGRWSPVPGLSQAAANVLQVTGPATFQAGLTWVVGAYLIGEVAALLLALILFARKRIPVARAPPEVVRDYIRDALPLMLVAGGGVALKRVDQVMVGFWYSAYDLGQYAAAIRLSDLLLILALAIEVVLLPTLSRLNREGNLHALRETVLEAERWISMLMWPVVAFVVLFSRDLIHILLSDQFLDAAPLLIILTFFTYFQGLRVPLKTKAVGIGQQGFAARVVGIAVLLNVVLNIIFIPSSIAGIPMLGLGNMGAAITTLVTGIFMFLAFRLKAKQWTEYPTLSPHLLRQTVAAVATIALLWATRPWMPVVRFYHLAAWGLVVFAIYLLLLVALRELRMLDMERIRAAMAGTTAKKES